LLCDDLAKLGREDREASLFGKRQSSSSTVVSDDKSLNCCLCWILFLRQTVLSLEDHALKWLLLSCSINLQRFHLGQIIFTWNRANFQLQNHKKRKQAEMGAASYSSLFERVVTIRCLVALDLGVGVEQRSIVSSSRAARPCSAWGVDKNSLK